MVDTSKLKTTDPYLLEIPEALTPTFTKYNNTLWWWEDDGHCYVWSGHDDCWVDGDDWWYDRPFVNYGLDVEEAKEQFPGALPVRYMTTKRLEARRRKLRRERKIANTDVQVFEPPKGLPAGFAASDGETRRTYSHSQDPEQHYFAWVHFSAGPRYFATYWLPGEYQKSHLAKYSQSFGDKNEAQAWVIEQLNVLEKGLKVDSKSKSEQSNS